MSHRLTIATVLTLILSFAQAQPAPEFLYDPTWPNSMPNLWKMGGVTGLAVDSNDDVWVYNRPHDATATELRAEPTPSIAVGTTWSLASSFLETPL